VTCTVSYKSLCQSHISNIKSFLPVEAEISVTKVFITANMKNSKSRGKQEVDVPVIIAPLVEMGLYCNHLVPPSICPSVHAFVKDVSAATGRND
jgi:hypothetical protein